MSTWKYGPEKVVEDSNGYCDPIDVEYAMEYQTTADILSIWRNGEFETGYEYHSARAVARMMVEWYLVYELGYSTDLVEQLFNRKFEEKK